MDATRRQELVKGMCAQMGLYDYDVEVKKPRRYAGTVRVEQVTRKSDALLAFGHYERTHKAYRKGE